MRGTTLLVASALMTAGLVGLVGHAKTRKPSYRNLGLGLCAGSLGLCVGVTLLID